MSAPAPDRWEPPREAVEAAESLRGLLQAARHVAACVEAGAMEAAWRIRRAIPDGARREAFIRSHTPLDPERAEAMALAWGGARGNRALRNLVGDKPAAALDLVRDAVAAIGSNGAEAAMGRLPEDDALLRVLRAGPRRRARLVRRMVAEAPEPPPETPPAPSGPPDAFDMGRAREAMRRVDADLDALLAMAAAVPPMGRETPSARRIIRWGDDGIARMEKLLSAVMRWAGD